jgi:hypothetical protein
MPEIVKVNMNSIMSSPYTGGGNDAGNDRARIVALDPSDAFLLIGVQRAEIKSLKEALLREQGKVNELERLLLQSQAPAVWSV